MTQYLLSMLHPGTGETPPPEALASIMVEVGKLREEMQAAGVWVFGNGLTGPESATVLRPSGDGVTTTDGPYLEGKEHLGGITIIDVPDLDEALRWTRRMIAAAPLPIEVRAFQPQ